MKPNPYYFFYSQKSPLSNWYLRDMVIKGITFNCMEQYMMYAKAMLFGDTVTAAKILAEPDQGKQKRLGRDVTPFDEDKWIHHRQPIVFAGLKEKFTQHDDLYDFVMSIDCVTFVEAAKGDKIWGVGLSADDPSIMSEDNWTGLNLLGHLITKMRNQFRTKEDKVAEQETKTMGFGNLDYKPELVRVESKRHAPPENGKEQPILADTVSPSIHTPEPQTLILDIHPLIGNFIGKISPLADYRDYVKPLVTTVTNALRHNGLQITMLDALALEFKEEQTDSGSPELGTCLHDSVIDLGLGMIDIIKNLDGYDENGDFEYEFAGFIQQGIGVFVKHDPVGPSIAEKFISSWPETDKRVL